MAKIDEHACSRLPFVRPEEDGGGRNWWSVTSTGNYDEDRRLGEKHALAFLEYLAAEANNPDGGSYNDLDIIVFWVTKHHRHDAAGIRRGFLEIIARYACSAMTGLAHAPYQDHCAWIETRNTLFEAERKLVAAVPLRGKKPCRKRHALLKGTPQLAIAAE